MTKNSPERPSAMARVLESLAYKGPSNMWSIKKDTELVYSTVYKAVNSLKKKGLLKHHKTVRSQKWGRTEIFKLSFRGFLTHLASYPQNFGLTTPNQNRRSLLTDEAWNEYVYQPIDTLEQAKKRHSKERRIFLKETEKLAEVIKRNGKLLRYPLFTECRILEKRFGVAFVYLNFLQIARMYHAYSPLGLDPAKMKALKKEQQGEKYRQTIHELEDEQIKRSFGEQFLQRIATVPNAKMPNKNLQAFAETLKKKREEEIKHLVTAVDMFS